MSKMRSTAQTANWEENVKSLAARNQIGADEFSRTPQQSQAGKTDQSGSDQLPG